jgi:hypothetical protein
MFGHKTPENMLLECLSLEAWAAAGSTPFEEGGDDIEQTGRRVLRFVYLDAEECRFFPCTDGQIAALRHERSATCCLLPVFAHNSRGWAYAAALFRRVVQVQQNCAYTAR